MIAPAFHPGDRVVYIGERPEHRHRFATVRRVIKSRAVVEIAWESDGRRYDAEARNLERADTPDLQGMEPTAQQAQDARDQSGRGAMRSHKPQKACDVGLFAGPPAPDLFAQPPARTMARESRSTPTTSMTSARRLIAARRWPSHAALSRDLGDRH